MDKILSTQGDSTLMFVIDTTDSMDKKISTAKAIAKQIICVTRDHEIGYILSPFSDPGMIWFCTIKKTYLKCNSIFEQVCRVARVKT